jgi:8-oxo-dGTP diphosphatase
MQISSGSKIFIKNKKTGRFLFILRDDIETIPYPNCWSIVGGGIEKGETPIEALKREIEEEINIKSK